MTSSPPPVVPGPGSRPPVKRPAAWTRALLLTAALAALSACAPLPQPVAESGAACQRPETHPEWAVDTPGAQGFDGAALCAALHRFAASGNNFHALLVERHGRLVAEVYRRGADRRISEQYGLSDLLRAPTDFDAQTRHDVRSISKSVVGLLVGVEVARGRFPDLDTPVLDLYPELADLRTDGRERITVRHLLTMTDGLAWREWQRGPLTSDETGLNWTASHPRYVLDRAMAAPAGSRFNYSGGTTAVLADLLERRTGKKLADLAREDLFAPMGITDWHWATDSEDRAMAFAGLQMRPRDLLKLGRMVLDHGQWQGRQIVPAAWLADSTRTHVATGTTFFPIGDETVSYGQQWWTGEVAWQGRRVHWAAAVGNGGQRLLLIPELDLSIVLTAGHYGEPGVHRTLSDTVQDVLVAVNGP